MKRTDRISPVIWAIGIIVIAATIFFAWLGGHSQRADAQLEESAPMAVSADSGSPASRAASAQGSPQGALASPGPNSILSPAIQITVVDFSGAPLADSQLQVQYFVQDGINGSRSSKSFTTDSNGVAMVGYPRQNLNSLDIGASHEKFSGRKMNWNLQSGDVVPASYVLKLADEITIGATVVDANDNPIPGATVSLNRFWSGRDDPPNKKGDQPDFRAQKQTTDPNGHWRATGLPEALMDHISFAVAHSNFLGTNFIVGANPAIEKQLLAETLKIVLPVGSGAHGLVIDANDRPIAGATVWAGRKYTRERQETTTDAEGRFNFPHVTEGDVPFAVNAPGEAPEVRTVTVTRGMPDIVFKLSAGHVIRGIVQDDSGSPISGVQVALDNSFGQASYDAYEFTAFTVDDGKFSWDGAPDEPLRFNFGKAGYEQKRNVTLKPDEDNVITLGASRRLEGLVLDSNSGQPIPQFSIRTGNRWSPDQSSLSGTIRNRDFNDPEGKFTVQIDQAEDNAVQVWNDDHLLKTESFPAAENGVMKLTIRLDPAAALKGIVTTADGTPVPGASVVATKGEQGMGIQLQGIQFRTSDSQTPIARTDGQGAFSISAPPEHGLVMAIASAGFASATIDQVRANPVIVLQGFGRIEGTLMIAGSPGAGEDLFYNPPVSALNADFQTYKTTADDQGHFTMENIPPGEGSIVRLIKSAPNSWTHSHKTPVTVQPGQTTQVTLGDSGAMLRGTVRFESPPTNGASLSISGNVSSNGPQLPSFNSVSERQTYMNSPEWQAQMNRMKNYFFMVNADGTFQVDSVAPGSYTIRVSARKDGDRSFMNPPVVQATVQFTVPDNADPMNPIFVGEIVLRPPPVR
jgi:hypothetical protein